MKVFVTGVAGQLGHDIINELAARNEAGTGDFSYVGSDLAPEYAGAKDKTPVTKAPYKSLDITDEAAVMAAMEEIHPDVILHCAAWTAVDLAEDEDKKEKVHQVNVVGTENFVKAAKKLDCKMVYISTDYVFNGQGVIPWEPDCKDYAPLNVYGQTKLAGELAVSENLEKFFIVRIAWVFGQNGKNFIKTMLNVAKTHESLTVVADQIGTPTYTYDLSKLLCDMIVTDKYGYYHATNAEVPAPSSCNGACGDSKPGVDEDHDADGCKTGYISWYDFTKEIFRQAAALGYDLYSGERLTVKPVTTAEYGVSKAARPFNSRLDKQKLTDNGFKPLPTWKDALERYIPTIIEEIVNG